MSWNDLKLDASLVEVLENQLKFKQPTAVQLKCVPQFLNRKDVVVEAPTGSGKTLAYLLPILQILKDRKLKKYEIGALILAPNRELALQIFEILQKFSSVFPLTSTNFIGGSVKLAADINNFHKNGCNIIVATPGRLEEALNNANLFGTVGDGVAANFLQCFKTVEILVLDEADRLFDLTFQKSLTEILQNLPKQRRTGLFSATQTTFEDELKKVGLRNEMKIVVKAEHKNSTDVEIMGTDTQESSSSRVPTTLQNYYTVVQPEAKFAALLQFLKSQKRNKILLFVSSCSVADYLANLLKHFLKTTSSAAKLSKAQKNRLRKKAKKMSESSTSPKKGSKREDDGIQILTLHGKKRASQRSRLFQAFKSAQKSCVLVCTDVMARGLDVPDVDWVVQYDLPRSANFFLHRCGRTARCGQAGSALLFLLPSELDYLSFLTRNQQVQLQEYQQKQEFFQIDSNRVEQVFEKIRRLSAEDRSLLLKGTRAFVSFIQSYSKHDCNIVCQLKDLDVVNVAHCFGLHRLPKMPELCDRDLSKFKHSSINTSEIKFNDKNSEQKRLEKKAEMQKIAVERKLKKQAKSANFAPIGKELAKENISGTTNNNDEKQKRNDNKKKEKEEIGLVKIGEQQKSSGGGNIINKKRKRENRVAENSEIEDDYKLLKKLKKGQMTKNEFDDEFLNV